MGGIVASKKGIDMIGLWFQKAVLHVGAKKHLRVGCQNTGPGMGFLALSVRMCLQVKPTWCGVVQPPPGAVGTQECGCQHGFHPHEPFFLEDIDCHQRGKQACVLPTKWYLFTQD